MMTTTLTQRYCLMFVAGFLAALMKDYLSSLLYGSQPPCQPVMFNFDNGLRKAIEQQPRLRLLPPKPPPVKTKPAAATMEPGHPSIACGILTMPENWDTKVKAVEYTWAKRCDYRYYIYSKSNYTSPQGGTPIDVKEGRDDLTGKSHALFRYLYKSLGDKVDWYVKADDDTYIIVENLKMILSRLDPNEAYYVGQTIRNTQGIPGVSWYNSGGAGREAARRLVDRGPNTTLCPQHGAYEDVDIGTCMQKLGVTTIHTADNKNRLTMHGWNPLTYFDTRNHLYHRYLNYRDIYQNNQRNREEMFSLSSVSFHYMDPGHMYIFDFFIHDLCVSGRGYCEDVRFPWEQKYGISSLKT